MEIEKPAGVEIKPNNSLMKKTKAQLIEIILRKDDVEKSLREELRKSETNVEIFKKRSSNLSQECGHIRETYNALRRDYEHECDEHTTDCHILNNKLKTCRTLAAVTTCVAIVAISMILIIFAL